MPIISGVTIDLLDHVLIMRELPDALSASTFSCSLSLTYGPFLLDLGITSP
jgi:hypothetical protein